MKNLGIAFFPWVAFFYVSFTVGLLISPAMAIPPSHSSQARCDCECRSKDGRETIINKPDLSAPSGNTSMCGNLNGAGCGSRDSSGNHNGEVKNCKGYVTKEKQKIGPPGGREEEPPIRQ
jgi:hypothetical protein